MARSKHTNPAELRARARLLKPHQARGKDDLTTLRSIVRTLKDCGVFLEIPAVSEAGPIARPRVSVKPARNRFTHPAGRNDILAVIEFFGEKCFYGLKAIKLSQRQSADTSTVLMGRLEVPGTIIIYEQPTTPWLITGVLTGQQKVVLERAGAKVGLDKEALQTMVRWSEEDLKNYMLFDVLMHEVGHHILQHYKGKRNVRIARTSDHEAFANLFAARCREAYFTETPDGDSEDDQ